MSDPLRASVGGLSFQSLANGSIAHPGSLGLRSMPSPLVAPGTSADGSTRVHVPGYCPGPPPCPPRETRAGASRHPSRLVPGFPSSWLQGQGDSRHRPTPHPPGLVPGCPEGLLPLSPPSAPHGAEVRKGRGDKGDRVSDREDILLRLPKDTPRDTPPSRQRTPRLRRMVVGRPEQAEGQGIPDPARQNEQGGNPPRVSWMAARCRT